MTKRRIFRKKDTNIFSFILFFAISFITAYIIFIYFSKNKYDLFIIDENIIKYYFIPDNKGGKIIPNQDIKILDYNNNVKKEIIKNDKIKFSIQLFASSKYKIIKSKYNNTLNKLSFIQEDLFVVALKHNLGIDYLLLYKNFNKRSDAFDYCAKYLNFIDNCLIVNVQNLN